MGARHLKQNDVPLFTRPPGVLTGMLTIIFSKYGGTRGAAARTYAETTMTAWNAHACAPIRLLGGGVVSGQGGRRPALLSP